MTGITINDPMMRVAATAVFVLTSIVTFFEDLFK